MRRGCAELILLCMIVVLLLVFTGMMWGGQGGKGSLGMNGPKEYATIYIMTDGEPTFLKRDGATAAISLEVSKAVVFRKMGDDFVPIVEVADVQYTAPDIVRQLQRRKDYTYSIVNQNAARKIGL